MDFFGIHWLGLNGDNGRRLALSLAFIIALIGVRWLLRAVAGRLGRQAGEQGARAGFWTQQVVSLGSALLLVLGLLSIWFDDPRRLTPALGLFSAGLAFALQRVITAVAGYFVLLHGRTFTVGDRITMGGVRGDVIALGFMQTTIMEMGQVHGADPTMWVKSRQFTGRIVTVSNAKIFDEPVYNYTRDFPYIWDEIHVTIPYRDDRRRAEEIMLASTRAHAADPAEVSAEAHAHLEQRYHLVPLDFQPRVYLRLSDHGVELTVRFTFTTHGVRSVKDAISRDILDAFEAANIHVAAPVREIVGLSASDLPNAPAGERHQPPHPRLPA